MYEGNIITEQGERRIFEGELVEVRQGRSRMRGFHLEDPAVMVSRGIVGVEPSRSAPDSRGVYRLQVAMGGVTRLSAFNCMFPRSWTRDQVKDAIAEAHAARSPEAQGWADRGQFYKGRTRAGMVILMELNEAGRVVDAFPVRAGNTRNNRRRDVLYRVKRGAITKHREVCRVCEPHTLKVLVCPNGHNSPFAVVRLYWRLRTLLGRAARGWVADVMRRS